MSTLTFDDLEQKYNRFLDPGCTIKIEGKAISDDLVKDEVTVDLPYGLMAASCTFTILNAFEKHGKEGVERKEELKELLQPGNQAEVLMGYGKRQSTVFFGYIDGITLDFNGEGKGVRITAVCLDAKGIMMNSFRSERKVGVTRFSDAVSDICRKYPGLIRKKIIDTTEEVKVPIEQHKESDYEFISRLAEREGYSFYLLNGVLYFQKKNTDREELICFRLNEYLQEFHLQTTLYRKVSKVTVRGASVSDPSSSFEASVTSYTGNADGSMKNAGENKLLNRNVTATVALRTVSSEKEAKETAQAIMDERFGGGAFGTAVLIGVPELIPGKVCSVEGFGKACDRKYRIARVIHRLTQDGYMTECELEGN